MSAKVTVTNDGPQRIRVCLLKLVDLESTENSWRMQQSIEVHPGDSFSIEVDEDHHVRVEAAD